MTSLLLFQPSRPGRGTRIPISLMRLTKQEALEAIGKLPDDTDFDETMYRLYVLDKIRKGRKPPSRARPSALRI